MNKKLLLLGLLIAYTLVLPFASAQGSKQDVTIVTHVDIIPSEYKAGSEERAGVLLREEAATSQRDSGLISYVVLQQNDAKNHFTIIETWQNDGAYQRHQGAQHTVAFRNEIQPFLGSPFDSRPHHLFR